MLVAVLSHSELVMSKEGLLLNDKIVASKKYMMNINRQSDGLDIEDASIFRYSGFAINSIVSNDVFVGSYNSTAAIYKNGRLILLGRPNPLHNVSTATGASADGSIIAGYSATSDTLASHREAFIYHNEKFKTISPLSSIYSDAVPRAVSRDGRVVVGESKNDSGMKHAFAYYNGSTFDLGTISGSGESMASDVSGDGAIIVGASSSGRGTRLKHAFAHYNGKMHDLGTLSNRAHHSSQANAISANGRYIVGHSEGDDFRQHAFLYFDGKMHDLGTLMPVDSYGNSTASAITPDGRVIVGTSSSSPGREHAFIYTNNNMVDLGTLNGKGDSWANGVSDDGTIIFGISETSDSLSAARFNVIWKIKYLSPPEPPVNPEPPIVKPEIIIINKDNSDVAMIDTANRGFKVLDLYQSALSSLANARCQMGESNYCIGVFSQLDSAQDNSRVSTGLFGSFKLPTNNWTLGAAINFANQTRLIDNYDAHGSSKPGFGVFTRYQDNANGSGLNIDISAAYIQQDITITRDKLSHTEAGKGESVVKGYQVGMRAVYAVNVNENTQLLPLAVITHHRVTRDGYSEIRNAEFPATYGEMGNERTELQLGINARHQVNPVIQLDGGMGTKIKLNEKRNAFTGHINYIGAYAYDKGEAALARPYVQAGVNFAPTKYSTLRVNVGFEKADYTSDTATVGLSYSYNW